MRHVLAVAALALLAAVPVACDGCDGGDCPEVAPGGACTADDECVLAYCASGCNNGCGLPPSYARSAIPTGSCFVPVGETPPADCEPPGIDECPLTGCPSVLGVPRCVSGQCTTVMTSELDAGADARVDGAAE